MEPQTSGLPPRGAVITPFQLPEPPVPPGWDLITFSEFPLETTITTQYRDRGLEVISDCYLTTDYEPGCLSGKPRFHGPIEIKFVARNGANKICFQVQFDYGYIDDPGSPTGVKVFYYDIRGNLLLSELPEVTGFNRVLKEGLPIHRILLSETAGGESAGFELDNLMLGGMGGAGALAPLRQAQLPAPARQRQRQHPARQRQLVR